MLAGSVDFELAGAIDFEFAFAAEFELGFGRSKEGKGAEKMFAVDIKRDREEGEENSAADNAAYNHGGMFFRTRSLCDFDGSYARGIEERG